MKFLFPKEFITIFGLGYLPKTHTHTIAKNSLPTHCGYLLLISELGMLTAIFLMQKGATFYWLISNSFWNIGRAHIEAPLWNQKQMCYPRLYFSVYIQRM
jgi:hypothetical protein